MMNLTADSKQLPILYICVITNGEGVKVHYDDKLHLPSSQAAATLTKEPSLYQIL